MESSTFIRQIQELIAKHRQKIIFFAVLIVCLISLSASLWLGISYWHGVQSRRQFAFEFGQQAADLTKQVVDAEMGDQQEIAIRLADDLTNGKLPYSELAARLRTDLETKPNLFGMGVAFEPYVYKPDLRLYAPYFRKDDQGKFSRVQVENFYDYTDKSDPSSSDWYYKTLDGNARWSLSGYDPAAQAVLVEYFVPFYRMERQTNQQIPAGIVYVDHSLDTIKTIVQSLDVGREGYNVLISDDGYIVSHPQSNLIARSIEDVATMTGDVQLVSDIRRAQAGEAFYRQQNAASGFNTWTFYKPLSSAGWVTATMMQQDAFVVSPQMTLRTMIWLSVAVMSFLISLAALIFRVERGSQHSLWVVSLSVCVVLWGGLIWIWWIVNENPIQTSLGTALTNSNNVEKTAEKIEADLETYGIETPVYIPTGLMIESMSIAANEATFSGYLWQKYPIGKSDEITQGVQFPDDLAGASMEEVYRFQKSGYEVVGWFFIANLKQTFQIEGYPLDQVNASIRLLPKILDENVILVPDLDEYDFTAPSHKPGLSRNLTLADFSLQSSYFGYQFDTYNAKMGGAAQVKRNVIPSLTFNISASRNILSPIIAFCITIVVVSGLMFGSVLVKLDSAFSALSNAAALFFVVAITHVGLRSTINASSVVYLEYLFIILYVFILGLAVNGMMVYSENPPLIAAFRDNLIAKLTFVPLLLSSFVAVTILTFYPAEPGDNSLPQLPFTEAVKSPTSTEPFIENAPVTDEVAAPTLVSTSIEPRTTPVAIPVSDDTVTLHYIIGVEPGTIDPSLSSTVSDKALIGNLFMGLTYLDAETNQAQPSLALNWNVSSEGLTWTFSMRRDVPWVRYNPQTGEASQVTDLNGRVRYVTAADVVYGIQRSLTSKNSAAVTLYPIWSAEEVNTGKANISSLGVKALDAWTVQFKLKEPAPYFAQLLSYDVSYPVPKWVVDEWGDEWTRLDNLQTHGPYLLADWDDGQQIQLLKNPFWPDADQVQIEQVIEIVSVTPEKTLDLYRGNNADAASGIGSEIIQTAQSDLVLSQELVFTPELCTYYFGFINNKPPFDDVILRRAFSAAIDRQTIVDLRQRGNLVAHTFAPQGVFGAVTDASLGISYDPDLAKQLFQQYLNERGLTLDDFNSAYPLVLGQVDIMDNSSVVTVLKNWQEIFGVAVITETVGREDFYARIAKDAPIEGAFNLVHRRWCADYPDQNNFVYTLFNAQDGINQVRRNCADVTCQTANPPNEFDRLTLEAGRSNDPAQRLELYAQAEQLLVYEEAAVAPVYYGTAAYLTKPWLTRNYPSISAPDFWNWKIDQAARK